MEENKVAVLGGGAGAYAEAFELAQRGFKVNMCEVPELKEGFKKVLDTGEIEATGVMQGVVSLNLATTNFEEAITGVRVIFLPVPCFAHKIFADYCIPHLEDGQVLVLTPGTCGSLVFIKELRDRGIKKDIVIAETATLPYGARILGPGHVGIFTKALNNDIGVFPAKKTNEVLVFVREFYPELKPLSNVLEAGLNSLNAAIHPPATLLNVGRIEYADEFWLYIEGMGPSAVKLMGAVMNERAKLGEALGFVLGSGEAIMERGKEALNELFAHYFEGGLKPGYSMKGPLSLEDRYVTEDVPYGLVLWESLANMVNIKVPVISSIIEVFSVITGMDFRTEGRTIDKLGLSGLSLAQMDEFLYGGER